VSEEGRGAEGDGINECKKYAPAYPKLFLTMIPGTLLLIGAAAAVGLTQEFIDGLAQTAAVVAEVSLVTFAILRLARVKVIVSPDRRIQIVNPVRSETVTKTDVLSVEPVGFVYKWLTLTTVDGKKIRVWASLYSFEPRGETAKALHSLLEGLGSN
jgi:hypothetical protein